MAFPPYGRAVRQSPNRCRTGSLRSRPATPGSRAARRAVRLQHRLASLACRGGLPESTVRYGPEDPDRGPRLQSPNHPQPPPTGGLFGTRLGCVPAPETRSRAPHPKTNMCRIQVRGGPAHPRGLAPTARVALPPDLISAVMAFRTGTGGWGAVQPAVASLTAVAPRHASEASMCCSRTALRAAREPGVAGRERSEPVLQRFGL